MPRQKRITLGDIVFHVINRGNGRRAIFESDGDYEAFLNVIAEAHARVPMRTVSYELMPNHWHFVLWPYEDGDLSAFAHWLELTHVRRWHEFRQTTGTGHLYQERFKSFPAESDEHFLAVCRYVERNALRAGLVARAEDWRWGSLHQRTLAKPEIGFALAEGPLPFPADWVELVNTPQTAREEERLRRCLTRGSPFGADGWVEKMARRLGLQSTLRDRGRPRKQ
jgi:putative transposase